MTVPKTPDQSKTGDNNIVVAEPNGAAKSQIQQSGPKPPRPPLPSLFSYVNERPTPRYTDPIMKRSQQAMAWNGENQEKYDAELENLTKNWEIRSYGARG